MKTSIVEGSGQGTGHISKMTAFQVPSGQLAASPTNPVRSPAYGLWLRVRPTSPSPCTPNSCIQAVRGHRTNLAREEWYLLDSAHTRDPGLCDHQHSGRWGGVSWKKKAPSQMLFPCLYRNALLKMVQTPNNHAELSLAILARSPALSPNHLLSLPVVFPRLALVIMRNKGLANPSSLKTPLGVAS